MDGGSYSESQEKVCRPVKEVTPQLATVYKAALYSWNVPIILLYYVWEGRSHDLLYIAANTTYNLHDYGYFCYVLHIWLHLYNPLIRVASSSGSSSPIFSKILMQHWKDLGAWGEEYHNNNYYHVINHCMGVVDCMWLSGWSGRYCANYYFPTENKYQNCFLDHYKLYIIDL